MHQSREALLAARPHHSPERGLNWTDAAKRGRVGYAIGGAGNAVGIDVGITAPSRAGCAALSGGRAGCRTLALDRRASRPSCPTVPRASTRPVGRGEEASSPRTPLLSRLPKGEPMRRLALVCALLSGVILAAPTAAGAAPTDRASGAGTQLAFGAEAKFNFTAHDVDTSGTPARLATASSTTKAARQPSAPPLVDIQGRVVCISVIGNRAFSAVPSPRPSRRRWKGRLRCSTRSTTTSRPGSASPTNSGWRPSPSPRPASDQWAGSRSPAGTSTSTTRTPRGSSTAVHRARGTCPCDEPSSTRPSWAWRSDRNSLRRWDCNAYGARSGCCYGPRATLGVTRRTVTQLDMTSALLRGVRRQQETARDECWPRRVDPSITGGRWCGRWAAAAATAGWRW